LSAAFELARPFVVIVDCPLRQQRNQRPQCIGEGSKFSGRSLVMRHQVDYGVNGCHDTIQIGSLQVHANETLRHVDLFALMWVNDIKEPP